MADEWRPEDHSSTESPTDVESMPFPSDMSLFSWTIERFKRPPKDQSTPLAVAGVFIFLPVLLMLSGVVLFALTTGASLGFFVRDAKAIYSIPFHSGALSSVGVLLWCTTASVCVLTSLVLRTVSAAPKRTQFLLSAGLLTSVLMVDDLLLIHEVFVPTYLGIGEGTLLATYAFLTASVLLYFRSVISRSAYALLLLSLAFLAGTIAFDMPGVHSLLFSGAGSRELRYLLRDGCKLFGIAGWFSYFGWTCYVSLVRQCTTQSGTRPPSPAGPNA
jgi:hypothetical protein